MSEAEALDAVYDGFEELFQRGWFAVADRHLEFQGHLISELSVDLLLAYLTATLPAADKLEHRQAFYVKTEESLMARGVWEADLLSGLEGPLKDHP